MSTVAVEVLNPLRRVPLSLIVDDSAPCVNLSWYWIRDRAAWKARRYAGQPLHRADGDPERIASHPNAIPSDFARQFAEWSIVEGLRGKFSLIPFPACLGTVDTRIEGHSDSELKAWLDVYRDLLRQNYDLTPEMLSHTFVVDLATWEPTDIWEQFDWEGPVEEGLLTEYIAAALRLLREVGVEATGVTSPGGFGVRMEETYARATLAASIETTGNRLPFYFLRTYTDRPPDVPIREMDRGTGTGAVSVIACTGDWFGGWTGYDRGDPDRFITPDLRGGRLVEVIEAGAPAVMCGHWPGFYFAGEEYGFGVLKEVKRRLDAYDPDAERTIWMTNGEIARYYAAREMATVAVQRAEDTVVVTVSSPIACPDFTFSLRGVRARSVRMPDPPTGGVRWMPERGSQRAFRAPGYLPEGSDTYIGVHLDPGSTRLVCSV